VVFLDSDSARRAQLHPGGGALQQLLLERVRHRRQITESWLELTVRFVAMDCGVRDLKDAMSREILEEFRKAGGNFASSSLDIVGLPPLRLERTAPGQPK
jgi:hypothetical protein